MEDTKGNHQVAGHKNNSLDVIMARLRDGEVYNDLLNDMEKVGRDGRAFTVTFTDTQLRTYTESYLYTQVENTIHRTRGVQYHYLIPEYSQVGRFHLHGVIVCDSLKSYGRVRINLNRKNGIIKVKSIDDSLGWAQYCLKSYHPNQ